MAGEVNRGRTPIVKLDDLVLGGSNIYGWDLVAGVAPVDRVYPVTFERAKLLKDRLGQEMTLSIKPENRAAKEYKVWLLEILAGDDPYMRKIRLADQRWLWPKRWISARLNWRRATGDTFTVGTNRIENDILPNRLKYAEYSLFPPGNPTTVWTAREALEYFLREDLNTNVRWKDEPRTQVEIQNLVLEDTGPAVVQQLLQQLPGMNGYIDPTGTYVIYDDQSQEETEILSRLPPVQAGTGTVVVTDKSGLRPRKVVCLFTPEIEIRFDYEEISGSGTFVTPAQDTPTLYNVAPSPDFLTGGPLRGSDFAVSENPATDDVTAARGSYVELSQLFDAWGSFGFFEKPVSFDALRRHATKYGFASFLQAWGNHPYEPFDGLKMARASAAATHWRRTFQIDEIYMQRLESVNSYRVALLVPHLGVYAPSPVFCDWTRRPSYKGFATGGDPNDQQGFLVRGYADLLDSAEPAPARVQIIDPQAGLFHIEPRPDPWGYTDNIWFGYPEDGFIPSQDIGKAKATAQMIYRHWFLVTLEGGWKMSTILTVVPGSPNTIDRFYQVDVDPPSDAGECNGPPVYLRIFPGVMTARFGWQDGEAGEKLKGAVLGDNPIPDELLINEKWVTDVANAAAARVYEALRDRPQGSLSVNWSPDVEPGGTIGAVKNMMRRGELSTSLDFPAAQQAQDIWRWLNQSTRQVVLMVMNKGGGLGGSAG